MAERCEFSFGRLIPRCQNAGYARVTFGQFDAWTYVYCRAHFDRLNSLYEYTKIEYLEK